MKSNIELLKNNNNTINRIPLVLKGRSKRVGEILGEQYRLVEVTGINKYNEALYKVECIKCGHIYNDARISDINRKIKNNEGCKHGPDHTTYYRWTVPRLGKIYRGMVDRCYNPNTISYKDYGERGITICDEWLKDPTSFDRWAMNNGYQDNFEINRKNPNKGYSPDNCEWVPPGYNSKFDRTDNYIFYINNERYTTTDVDSKFNFKNGVTRSYLKVHGYKNTQKWINDMITGKISIPNSYSHTVLLTIDNLSMSLTDWSRYLNTNYSVLYYHYTHDSKEDFIVYIRYQIISNLQYIDLYGYKLSFIQLSNITGCNINWLKEGYIKNGVEFLMDAMRYNGVTVVEDVIKK